MKSEHVGFRTVIFLVSSALLLISGTAPPNIFVQLETCTAAAKASALRAAGIYEPSSLEHFITLQGDRFILEDSAFPVRGINYYPSQYPWRRFLTETDLVTIESDFTLLADDGFNTLRIFLWNDALFQCPGSGAVPQPENLRRLDAILHEAAQANLRLIVTLNDLPRLATYALYTDPSHTREQTAYLIQRYRGEAAILAWDVRNEGDIDYGTHSSIRPVATKAQVLNWLDVTTTRIRSLDPNHLITAGWLYDAQATAPYVDFVSFHHWTGADSLSARVTDMRSATGKPLLLQEVGYSTQRMPEAAQADALHSIANTSDDLDLLGWLVWAAFDFPVDRSCYPTPCLSPDNGEHYFGLWRTDGTPKPALEALAPFLTQ